MTYRFGGSTYNPPRDRKRLSKQFERVRDLMLDGQWRTLREISDALTIPEASASARLRDLRKPEFGSFLVESKHVSGGLHRYRVRRAKVEIVEPIPAPELAPGPIALFDPAEAHKPLGAYDEQDAA